MENHYLSQFPRALFRTIPMGIAIINLFTDTLEGLMKRIVTFQHKYGISEYEILSAPKFASSLIFVSFAFSHHTDRAANSASQSHCFNSCGLPVPHIAGSNF